MVKLTEKDKEVDGDEMMQKIITRSVQIAMGPISSKAEATVWLYWYIVTKRIIFKGSSRVLATATLHRQRVTAEVS